MPAFFAPTALREMSSKVPRIAAATRVLVVEDERIIARHVSVRLQKLGYQVAGLAYSKREALELTKNKRPDLVLMDIQLNGVPEGIDAAREIRDRFRIPVVYVTSHSDAKTLEMVKATEPFGYLLKPFEDRDVAVVIETAVERHRIEKRLKESEERLHLAQRAGCIGVFDWNLETRAILLTAGLEEIYGIQVGTFEGTHEGWIRHFYADDRAGFLELIEQWTASDRTEEHWEHRILTPKGEVRWLEAHAKLYRDSTGQTIRVLGTEQDITDRKRMQEALREKELQLERSNADLQAYGSTVSHDLKQPLRGISVNAELLFEHCGSSLDPDSRQFLTGILQSASRMKNLVEGLLAFSRVGQDADAMTPVDCNAVLDEVLASLSVRIKETGAHFTIGSLPTVQAWPGRLNQLFQNLIGNALNYSKPETVPEIGISAEQRAGVWQFAVTDNGIGFEMQHAESIFGVFKRLHANAYEGTGIGLSICKRIVERHRGRIWALSTPGQGSTFFFTLEIDNKELHHRTATIGS